MFTTIYCYKVLTMLYLMILYKIKSRLLSEQSAVNYKNNHHEKKSVGDNGLEPLLIEPKSIVLPLH